MAISLRYSIIFSRDYVLASFIHFTSRNNLTLRFLRASVVLNATVSSRISSYKYNIGLVAYIRSYIFSNDHQFFSR